MTADAFLERIASMGVSLTARDGRLVYRAPKGVITPDLIREIKGRERDLLHRLERPGATDIPRLPDSDRYPLSHAQRRLWILDQLVGPLPAYHIPLVQLVDGPLDVAALRRAVTQLVQRHEALRTVFDTAEGTPFQRIIEHIDPDVQTSDVSRASDPDSAALAHAQEVVASPFDLRRGPLFRVELTRLNAHRHLMIVVLHHLIADGVSITVLARDLAELYAASGQSREPRLPALRIHYRDFAAWQNAFLDGPDAAAHRAYWVDKLSPPLPVVDLPSSHPRPAHSSAEGREELFEIDREIVGDLRGCCAAAGASLFMGLVAAVTAVLHRYTGAEEIVLGSPVAGRDHADVEHAIGVFINTIVLRNEIRRGMSFHQLLASVARNTVEALDHRAYPFDRLVDDLDLPRDLSRSPLVDVLVILQNQQTEPFALEGLHVTPVYLHTGTSKMDLTFTFHASEGRISLGLEYRTDLFEPDRVRQLGRHLLALLRQAVRDPARPLAHFDMLSSEERELVVERPNRTTRHSPGELTLLDFFRQQVEARPDATAVACAVASLSYRALDIHSDRVANRLRQQGTAPESLVGICVDRTAAMLVGLLGILKTGAAYVPLDPGFPRERLAFMMRDSGASLLLTRAHLAASIATGHAVTVLLDDAMAGELDDAPDVPRITPDHVAYVNYTSGSTGTPKGVAVTHGNLANLLRTMAEAPGMSPTDVLLAVTTLSFDIAGLELYLPLVTGGRVVIATSDEAGDGLRLRDLLTASAATVMQATPATWRMLFAAGWRPAPRLKVLCGGEALPGPLAAALLRGSADVWNLYGPTETTIWSAAYRVTGSPDDWDQTPVVPIGHPVANTTVYVVDRDLNPVPIGCQGDLYIGGDGVARGYLHRPDLTADRFIPDRFAARPGARLYRTGDRAAFRDDGAIEFLGRDDGQVKIRGFRIEVGEIELALEEHPDVAQGVVVTSSDADSAGTLVAYVAASGRAGIDRAALRAHLKRLLPDYMIPSALVVLERLPLTPNGKVDRNALPRPSRSSLSDDNGPAAPRDDLERALADAWKQVLALDEVGVHDNFFELGGHSLRATRLVYHLQLALGVDLGLIDIFKAPTIAALAARLRPAAADHVSTPNRHLTGVLPGAEPGFRPLTAEERDLLDEP